MAGIRLGGLDFPVWAALWRGVVDGTVIRFGGSDLDIVMTHPIAAQLSRA